MDNLTEYRLANAKEKLESAKLLLDAGKYKDSIGRSYYAIFSVCSLSNLFFRFHTTTLTEACSNELKQHHL